VNRLEQLVTDSMSVQRLTLLLSSILAALAAGLTALGIYGVVSYATSQPTREIGLRMALGAGRSKVFWLVVKQGLTPAAFGLVGGLALALGTTRWLAGQLYGVRSADPLTYAGVTLLLAVIALSACAFPARRATKVDPLAALRHD
jgi:ABC-type antimicrobial peptide transport system permease subunit